MSANRLAFGQSVDIRAKLPRLWSEASSRLSPFYPLFTPIFGPRGFGMLVASEKCIGLPRRRNGKLK